MRKAILLFVVLLFAVSCAKQMRYTNEEIRDFPPQVQERIKKGEIATGMTYIQVRYAWGAPTLVNILPPNEMGFERVEWIYRKFPGFKTVMRFTDGKLTEIISSEPGIAK